MKWTPAARHAGMRTEAGATSNLGEKMKKLIGVAVLVCMTSLFGMAGEVPKPEFFFSSRRRHTRLQGDWSSDVCSSDLVFASRQIDGQTARLSGECEAADFE